MKRAFYWGLGVVVATTLVSKLLFDRYSVPLIYIVVVNATLQKAPSNDRARLEAAFEQGLRKADQHREGQVFLDTLFAISQRVEKVQKLSEAGSAEIIRMLDKFSNETGP
ncbi:MAG: hypothetical protein HY315_02870 [Acidobacteria bacterium]|nr:hypothetical protein [Acidobacteriota bacterium]